jgi:hypothetical protein
MHTKRNLLKVKFLFLAKYSTASIYGIAFFILVQYSI